MAETLTVHLRAPVPTGISSSYKPHLVFLQVDGNMENVLFFFIGLNHENKKIYVLMFFYLGFSDD